MESQELYLFLQKEVGELWHDTSLTIKSMILMEFSHLIWITIHIMSHSPQDTSQCSQDTVTNYCYKYRFNNWASVLIHFLCLVLWVFSNSKIILLITL